MKLKPGSIRGSLAEVKLENTIIVREELHAGMQIEAAPPGHFFPLAAILYTAPDSKFCGREFTGNELLQGTGGEWNMYIPNRLDYISSVVDARLLEKNAYVLTGRDTSPEWFVSQTRQMSLESINAYKNGMNYLFKLVEQRPFILESDHILAMLDSQIMQLTVDALTSASEAPQTIVRKTKRLRGVRQVVDYLKAAARDLPTIPELCAIARMSQRSLEYGFREQFGVTPIQYMRFVRLNGAREDLLKVEDSQTRISDIALRWGFIEFGRFAADYNRLFDELPSQTLRNRDSRKSNTKQSNNKEADSWSDSVGSSLQLIGA
ncbi:helix-turn-helix domain-containing protein [Endozoicomonadaceae bacterium StTr2]